RSVTGRVEVQSLIGATPVVHTDAPLGSGPLDTTGVALRCESPGFVLRRPGQSRVGAQSDMGEHSVGVDDHDAAIRGLFRSWLFRLRGRTAASAGVTAEES